MSLEFLCFTFVGVVGFIVDGGGTWLLVQMGMLPVVSRIGPLLLAILVTWLLNRSLTFKVNRPKSRVELLRYLAVALSSAAMNFGLYSVLVILGVHPMQAVATATLVLLLYSFFGYRRMVFR